MACWLAGLPVPRLACSTNARLLHRPRHLQAQPHGRVYNFSAGPAMLSLDVLESCQKDMLNWNVRSTPCFLHCLLLDMLNWNVRSALCFLHCLLLTPPCTGARGLPQACSAPEQGVTRACIRDRFREHTGLSECVLSLPRRCHFWRPSSQLFPSEARHGECATAWLSQL